VKHLSDKNIRVDSLENLKAEANDVADLIEEFQASNLKEVGCGYLIDTPDAVAHLVDSLLDLPRNPPSLYMDIEGVNLSRLGSVSILQILVLPCDKTYLVDIHVLKGEAFTTAGATGQTLKDVLESATIPKVFFDVRNDSDALFSHFNVSLACLQDIQLMELATRTYSKRCVNGLARCIERDLAMTASERRRWTEGKDRGKRLFAPELGGSYEVFNMRPLAEEIALYCTQDVKLMPKLWKHYFNKLSPTWAVKVEIATKDRIALSHTAGYNGKGRHMALGPW
jgi:exonuclease 3'-5' domain-containing protein 1